MPFEIRELYLRNFRNHRELFLRDLGAVTVLVGPNAVGKTNVVEGVQLLTSFSSFRHQPLEYLIREGCSEAYLKARMEDGARVLETALTIQPGKKIYQRNGKTRRPSDLHGSTAAVVFTPDDLELVKGSHAKRREAIDALGCQVSKNYAAVHKDVETVVKQKNRLLHEEASPSLIESINDVMVTCGAQLTCYREALIRRLLPYLVESYRSITSTRECLSLGYVESWKNAGRGRNGEQSASPPEGCLDEGWIPVTQEEARRCLAAALQESRDEELRRRRCLIGPHADHLDFYIAGKHAGCFGSQGQQRSAVLAWKLAEVALIEEMMGCRPVVLLDDVMSELDSHRREALVNLVADGLQVVITTTNLSYFSDDLLRDSMVVELGR